MSINTELNERSFISDKNVYFDISYVIPEDKVVVNTNDDTIEEIKSLITFEHSKPSFFSDKTWSEYRKCFPWLYYSGHGLLCKFCEEAFKQDRNFDSRYCARGNSFQINGEILRGYNISRVRFERHSMTKSHILAMELLNLSPSVDCSICERAYKINNENTKNKNGTIRRLDRHEKCRNHLFAVRINTLDMNGLIASRSNQNTRKRHRKSVPVKSYNEIDTILPIAVTSYQFYALQSRYPWLVFRNKNSFLCKLCPDTNSIIEFSCGSPFSLISIRIQDHCKDATHKAFIKAKIENSKTQLQLGFGSKLDYKGISNGENELLNDYLTSKKFLLRSWSCPQCKSHFTHNLSLVQHISLCDYQSIENIRNISCPCNPQFFHFNSVTKLDLHAAQEHAADPLFNCYICLNRYSRLLELYNHMIVHHLIPWDPYEAYASVNRSSTPSECIFCGTLAITNAELTDHYCLSPCKIYLQPAVVVEEINIERPSSTPQIQTIKPRRKYVTKKWFTISPEIESSLGELDGSPINVKRKFISEELTNAVCTLKTDITLNENSDKKHSENDESKFAVEDDKSSTTNHFLINDATSYEFLKKIRKMSDTATNDVETEEMKCPTDKSGHILEIKKRIRVPSKKLKDNAELDGEKMLAANKVTASMNMVTGKRPYRLSKLSYKTVLKKERNLRKKNGIVNLKRWSNVVDDVNKKCDSRSPLGDTRLSKEINRKDTTETISNGPMKAIKEDKQIKTRNYRKQMTTSDKIKAIYYKQYRINNLKDTLGEEIDKQKNCSDIKPSNVAMEQSTFLSETPYPCGACKRKFQTLGARDKHVMMQHKGTRLFECHMCDVSARTHLLLRKHAIRYHAANVYFAVFGIENHTNVDMVHRCQFCQLFFSNKQGMLHHISSRHGISFNKRKPVIESQITDQCSDIVDEFVKKLIDADPKSGACLCSSCHQMMNNEFELTVHSMEHERKKENNSVTNQFACPKCCRLFFGQEAKSYLKDHYNIFHLYKPYPNCEECKSEFLSSWCLDEHKRTVEHCSTKSVNNMKISDPYEPLHDPVRLGFVCSCCQCLIAGDNAQARFNEHRRECCLEMTD